MGVRVAILQSFFIIGFCSHLSEQFKIFHFLFKHFVEIGKRCDCKCGGGTYSQRNPRLMFGVESYPSEFPWVAVIYHKNDYFTTGSLINDRYVLTGASQIYSTPQSLLTVSLNKFRKYQTEAYALTVGISAIIYHPGFTANTDLHDIALLRLAANIKFRFPLVPICLPSPGVCYNGKLAAIASFKSGVLQEQNEDGLHKIELPILPKQRCSEKIYKFEGIVGIDNILCMNDSGAGVQYENHKGYYELIGVVTAKQSCDPLDATRTTTSIPIMTTVQHYLKWIYENTRDACFCEMV